MLSESVIEELLRDAPMREHLVQTAWPDLSVESRLQIIQIISDAGHNFVPTWLAALAMEDDAAIVRYWAAKSAYLKAPIDNAATGVMRDFELMFAPTPEESRLYDKVKNDECELVRIRTERGVGSSYETLTEEPQVRRLALIRVHSRTNSRAFFEWLGHAIDEGVPDLELAECTSEFLALPAISWTFLRTSDDFIDGFDAYGAGQEIRAGWDAAKKAGPALQGVLARQLPLKMGLTTIGIDEQASMPERVLAELLWRSGHEASLGALSQLVRSHPERFSEHVLKALERVDQVQSFDAEAIADDQARRALNQTRSVLNTILLVKQKVVELSSQLEAAKQDEPRRRGGFFGR
ncbi:hypothetical protein [Achromobacter aloeverae]